MWRAVPLGLLVTAVASSAVAQEAPLRPGQRVRVQSAIVNTPVVTGAVEAIRPDTLVVRPEDGASGGVATAIPLSSIARLQVSQGRHSKWVTGLVVGLGIGVGGGAILGATTCEGDFLFTTGDCAVMGATLFGAVGAVSGTVVGLLTKSERWESVPVNRVRPTVGRGFNGRANFGIAVVL